MKMQYLGTAAAEGVPALFCACDVCKKSRKLGGKNIRSRSQALIDGKILIDFPADTYYHSITHGIEFAKIHTCIITHNHHDHLYATDLENRKIEFAHTDEPTLTMYGTYPTYTEVITTLLRLRMDEQGRVAAKRIEPFVPFYAEGYKITPLKADHDLRCDPVIYIVEKDGKALMYAHDTGIFLPETWEWLKENQIKLDLISLDCTEPMTGIFCGHMSLDSAGKVRRKLIDYGLTHHDTKFILNHFSHNGKVTYDELVPIAEKDGFIVSYDGMCIDF